MFYQKSPTALTENTDACTLYIIRPITIIDILVEEGAGSTWHVFANFPIFAIIESLAIDPFC